MSSGSLSSTSLNFSPNPVNYNLDVSEAKRDVSRASDVRRDTDTVKNYSVTLKDIDTTILTYINEAINPTVVNAGVVEKVPVMYASPERWKSIQVDGFVRDQNGKIQCPIMVIRRSSMQRNENLVTFNRHLKYPAVKIYSQKNQYDKFSVMSGFNPVREVYSVTMPDQKIITYDLIVWTDYVEQCNSVIEKIDFATDEYWGNKNGFKFRTAITDYQFPVEVPADTDRVVKANFSMMCYAPLLPKNFEDGTSTTEKSFTARKIVVTGEVAQKIPLDNKYPYKMTRLEGSKVPVLDEGGITDTTSSFNSVFINNKLLNFQSTLNEKFGYATLKSNNVSGVFSGSFSGSTFAGSGVLYPSEGILSGSMTYFTVNVSGNLSGSSLFLSPSSFGNSTGSISSPISGSVLFLSGSISTADQSFTGSFVWSPNWTATNSIFVAENTTISPLYGDNGLLDISVSTSGKTISSNGVIFAPINNHLVVSLVNSYLQQALNKSSTITLYGDIT